MSRYSVNKPFLNGTKWKEDKPARIEIRLEGINGIIPRKDSLKKDEKYGDYFHINDFCFDYDNVDSADILTILLTPEKGIIHYK